MTLMFGVLVCDSRREATFISKMNLSFSLRESTHVIFVSAGPRSFINIIIILNNSCVLLVAPVGFATVFNGDILGNEIINSLNFHTSVCPPRDMIGYF